MVVNGNGDELDENCKRILQSIVDDLQGIYLRGQQTSMAPASSKSDVLEEIALVQRRLEGHLRSEPES